MKKVLNVFLLCILACACAPKQDVVLRDIALLDASMGEGGMPILKAEAIFFNPNNVRMRLKKIEIDIFVDEKKAARVDQRLSALIKANSEFTVPLEMQLQQQEGFLQTIMGFFGGKKHDIHFIGRIKVSVRGLPVSIPVDHKDAFKF